MDDEDYLALIALVERRLAEVGAAELADPDLYVQRSYGSRDEVSVARVLEPRKRLTEMLLAFERHMQVRDRAMHDEAVRRINARLAAGHVEAALVMPAPGDEARRAAYLGEAPDLASLRQRLFAFVGLILEMYRPGGETP